jgi:serine protease
MVAQSKALSFGLMLAFFLSAVAAAPEYNPVSPAPSLDSGETAQVIVRFKKNARVVQQHPRSRADTATDAVSVSVARTRALALRVGRALGTGRAIDEDSHVVTAEGVSSQDLALRLGAQADIAYAEVDHRRWHYALPNDPLYVRGPAITQLAGGPDVGQWYLRSPRGAVVSSINATVAWDVTRGASSVVVAVLDSGVLEDHPDLAGPLLPGYDMVSGVSTANDGDARDASAADPGDWITEAESKNSTGTFFNCKVSASSWHGTKTASLIGATSNNAVGMTGVAWETKLLPVRVLGKCGGRDSDIIAGMRWAAGLSVPGIANNAHPARVLNLSLGGSGVCSQSYIDTISALANLSSPVVVIAAAGNTVGHAVGVPANCPGVVGVSGLRHIGTKVGFSDIGPEIAISAPGGNCVNIGANEPCLYSIITARNTGNQGPLASSYSDSFAPSVGTSFSAPLVSGTVALMLSLRPELTPSEIKSLLQKSARPFPSPPAGTETPICRTPDGTDQLECHCTTTTCGAGMLDAAAAVNAVLEAYPASTLRFSFDAGWNLSGNASASPVPVASVFADTSQVDSVWSWDAGKTRWSFYSPSLLGQALSDFLVENHYDRLTAIDAGSGFWLKAKQAFVATVPNTAAAPSSVLRSLRPGWNLLAIGAATSANQLSTTLGQAATAAGTAARQPASLWTWNSIKSRWYFYSAALDSQGGTALQDFSESEGYLDFFAWGKSLTPMTGFWVNVPY